MSSGAFLYSLDIKLLRRDELVPDGQLGLQRLAADNGWMTGLLEDEVVGHVLEVIGAVGGLRGFKEVL